MCQNLRSALNGHVSTKNTNTKTPRTFCVLLSVAHKPAKESSEAELRNLFIHFRIHKTAPFNILKPYYLFI